MLQIWVAESGDDPSDSDDHDHEERSPIKILMALVLLVEIAPCKKTHIKQSFAKDQTYNIHHHNYHSDYFHERESSLHTYLTCKCSLSGICPMGYTYYLTRKFNLNPIRISKSNPNFKL